MTRTPFDDQLDNPSTCLKSIAIEGWRGINHSFALVNQHQILELLKFEGLKLFHRDLPFAFPQWTRTANASGLSPDQQAVVDALQPPADEKVDCIYRIGSPFRAGSDDETCRTVTYMITELGLTAASFEKDNTAAAFTRHDNVITTPSRWSKARLIEWGFPENKIELIAHGVDGTVFTPLPPNERQAKRKALGIADDETVFLNVGLPTWNKGIDLLLAAFATLRAAGRKVRLILKDQRDLYGLSVETLISTVGATYPALLAADTLGAITVIPNNLGTSDLRLLFAVADCYVSPYRAEGFNLPVMEAIACGTRVIVTQGGATDDFCTDAVALHVPGTAGCRSHSNSGDVGRYIEPNLPDLIAAMDCLAADGTSCLKQFEVGRLELLHQFTWRNAAKQLLKLTVDHDVGLSNLERGTACPPVILSARDVHPTIADRRQNADNLTSMAVTHQVTHLIHQIYITDQNSNVFFPEIFQENQRVLKSLYPYANLKMWNAVDLRIFISENFDKAVLETYDALQPYAFKADLGRLCLLYVYGGLYVDVAIRFLNPLNPPLQAGISTFACPWNGSPTWVAMTNGILWSRPKRRELQLSIKYIVENHRIKFYGQNCLYPTGPVCLGRAFAQAMSEKLNTDTVDDQWIGVQRALTPEFENKNWCFISADSSVTAISMKKFASDLSHLGALGTNNYFKIWCERNVYGERQVQ